MKTTAVKSAILDVDWSAQTVLPIDFKGRELKLEARAYQGADPQDQALVLINRGTNGHSAVTPLVRVIPGALPAIFSTRSAATAISSFRRPWKTSSTRRTAS